MRLNKSYIIQLIIIVSMMILGSCEKESNSPEISFKLNNSEIICKNSEDVYSITYPSQEKLSIYGDNHASQASTLNQEKFEIKFIIEQVDHISELIGKEIPLKSHTINPSQTAIISGLIHPNTHASNFEFTEILFKITSINNNKLNGIFSGKLQSISDQSTMEVKEGKFSDISIQDLIK